MNQSTLKGNLKELALRGFIAGSLIGSTSMIAKDALAGSGTKSHDKDTSKKEHEKKFFEVHACAGLNVCKGLGGCSVTQEKLEKLSKKMGIPVEKAGKPHACAGLNECKGLGGCKVTAEKFAKLKKKLKEAK